MNNDAQLIDAADAFKKDVFAELAAHTKSRDTDPSKAAALTARIDAIGAEHQRRTRAGVGVSLNAGDFESRRSAVTFEVAAAATKDANDVRTFSASLVSLLARAVGLLSEMGEALQAHEDAAAEGARAEADTEAAAAREASARAEANERAIDVMLGVVRRRP